MIVPLGNPSQEYPDERIAFIVPCTEANKHLQRNRIQNAFWRTKQGNLACHEFQWLQVTLQCGLRIEQFIAQEVGGGGDGGGWIILLVSR